MESLFPALAAGSWSVHQRRFPQGRYFVRGLQLRQALRDADLVVLQKIKVSPPEAGLLRRWSRRLVLDLDDAIYLRKPRRPGGPAQDSLWRRVKFESTCRAADLVVVGNEELAANAAVSARRVEVVPTAIDLERYRASVTDPARPPTVVWVGRPENLIALELIRPALARLAGRLPGLRLRVVCSRFPEWSEVAVDRVPWSPEAEIEALATADVGLMPLADDGWSRGKCAFKLLQYMAASLPCVASPVGANREAVIDGVTGFLPDDLDGWESALLQLLGDPEQRRTFGRAGRAHVEVSYSMPAYRTRYLEAIERAIGVSSRRR
jgi:glycosyltransferase involved in cell wall biosynthesis